MTHIIAISIINYCTPELTLACVQSVLADIGDLEAHIVIVDNASDDGSAEVVENWIGTQPKTLPVTLIKSARNTGFSGGHNISMQLVAADYYLLMNSDGVLRPGCLTGLVAAADANPKSGFIAPQIETETGDIQVSCFRFASITSEFIRGSGSGPITKLLRHRVVALPPPVKPENIEWGSFACILLRADMVQALGPMDEGYFLYFEDAEYCLRARNAGWGVQHEPSAVMVHFRGGSGPVKAMQAACKRLPAYFYASRTRFFWQRYGRIGPVMANLSWMAGRSIQQVRRILGKSVAPTIEYEVRDIWINTFNPDGPRCAPDE